MKSWGKKIRKMEDKEGEEYLYIKFKNTSIFNKFYSLINLWKSAINN